MLELLQMIIGIKPGGLVHPLPVVITTFKEAALTKRATGPTHQSIVARGIFPFGSVNFDTFHFKINIFDAKSQAFTDTHPTAME
jgi:hypothetical protein